MTVTYDIDINDMMAFQKHFFETNGNMQKTMNRTRIRSSAVFLALGVLCCIFLRGSARIALVVYFIAAAFLFYAVIPRTSKKRWLKNVRTKYLSPGNAILLGERTIEFRENVIYAVTEQTEETIKWKAVTDAHELPGYIFINFSEVSALVVPTTKIGFEATRQLKEILAGHTVEVKKYEK